MRHRSSLPETVRRARGVPRMVALLAIGMVVGSGMGRATDQAVRPATTPRAWAPPAAPSPLREIWSFDTKG